MENNNMTVPYIVYESMLDKEDRQQRRMVVIIVLLIVLLVVTNLLWLYSWNRYDFIDEEEMSVELDSDDGGNANYIGSEGDIYNGIRESNETEETRQSP